MSSNKKPLMKWQWDEMETKWRVFHMSFQKENSPMRSNVPVSRFQIPTFSHWVFLLDLLPCCCILGSQGLTQQLPFNSTHTYSPPPPVFVSCAFPPCAQVIIFCSISHHLHAANCLSWPIWGSPALVQSNRGKESKGGLQRWCELWLHHN